MKSFTKAKFFAALALALLCASAQAKSFKLPMDSRKGWMELSWGSSVADAKKAGYKLKKVERSEWLEVFDALQAGYTDPVDIYFISGKGVKAAIATYHADRLFLVTDDIIQFDSNTKSAKARVKLLESRYGNFNERGIITTNNEYFSDANTNSMGDIIRWSIRINIDENTASVSMHDWSVYKTLDAKLAKQGGNINSDGSLVSRLKDMAAKLLQDGKNGNKASFAFVALQSDTGGADVENYVTDALTEAVFNTGKVRIIERANLEKILAEQKFQTSGLVDDATAKAIGNIAGVDYVCYGAIKDSGGALTVSARVVDVESGEICAMSRATVQKDSYLASHSGAGASKGAAKTAGKTSASPAPKSAIPSAWIVRKSRNDFDECTVYTFMTPCPPKSKQFLFLGYEKYDNPINSKVRAGGKFNENDWFDCKGNFDMKDGGGKINAFHFPDYNCWSYDRGYKSEFNDHFPFGDNKSLATYRQIVEILLSSDYVSVRRSGETNGQRFQTAGLEGALAAEGITREELMAAFKSEEF